eukprot:1161187-Pelagomonas_calceolata.AAC.10
MGLEQWSNPDCYKVKVNHPVIRTPGKPWRLGNLTNGDVRIGLPPEHFQSILRDTAGAWYRARSLLES